MTTRKAPAYLSTMVISLELMIFDKSVPIFLRFVAWRVGTALSSVDAVGHHWAFGPFQDKWARPEKSL
eukprot:11162000-Karenia_brevis.AAC.1